ncbi:helix-turn-helix domain-containing protein [Mycobacterium ahvazicum]|uniref:helix-turn-helix domain-containing protein n=1 Tax=Mycobacterium ahvazicum TaxID=1964395 RepID=UPI003C6D3F96
MGDIGVLVRSVRTARGMTQADLAARLKTGRDWVVRLEKGHPRLEAQRVLDALRVLGVSLEATAPQAHSNDRAKLQRGAGPKGSDSTRTADPFAALFGMKSP